MKTMTQILVQQCSQHIHTSQKVGTTNVHEEING